MTAVEREDFKSIVEFVCKKHGVTEAELKNQLHNAMLTKARNDLYYIGKRYIHDIGDIAKYVKRSRSRVWQDLKTYDNKLILEEYRKWRKS